MFDLELDLEPLSLELLELFDSEPLSESLLLLLLDFELLSSEFEPDFSDLDDSSPDFFDFEFE